MRTYIAVRRSISVIIKKQVELRTTEIIKRLTKKKGGELKKQEKLFMVNAKAALFENIVVHGKVHLMAKLILYETLVRNLQWRVSIEQYELDEDMTAMNDFEEAIDEAASARHSNVGYRSDEELYLKDDMSPGKSIEGSEIAPRDYINTNSTNNDIIPPGIKIN